MADETPTPAPVAEGPHSTVATGIPAQLKQLTDLTGEWATQRQGVEQREGEAWRAIVDAQQEKTQARLNKVTQAADKVMENVPGEAPKPPDEPRIPSNRPQPFLEGEGGDRVQRLLMGVGMLAQMGMGLFGGYPAGALVAYAGALEGWKEGDQARRDADWQDYVAHVNKAGREYKRQRDQYDDIVRKWGMNRDMLQTHLQVAMAENGLGKDIVSAARTRYEDAMGMVDAFGKLYLKTAEDTLHASMEMKKYDLEKERMDLQLKQMDEARKRWESGEASKWARFNATQKRLEDFHAVSDEDKVVKNFVGPYQTQTYHRHNLDMMKQAFNVLDKEGVLPKTGGTPFERWVADVQKSTAFNNPRVADALAVIKAHWGPTVIGGMDRSTFNEIGVRAGFIFKDQLDLQQHMYPAHSMRIILDNWSNILDNKQAFLRQMIQRRAPHLMNMVDEIDKSKGLNTGFVEGWTATTPKELPALTFDEGKAD